MENDAHDNVDFHNEAHTLSSLYTFHNFFKCVSQTLTNIYMAVGVYMILTALNPNPRCQRRKGLSCFEKQTAKHFLNLKKFKNLGIPGKLYKCRLFSILQ